MNNNKQRKDKIHTLKKGKRHSTSGGNICYGENKAETGGLARGGNFNRVVN